MAEAGISEREEQIANRRRSRVRGIVAAVFAALAVVAMLRSFSAQVMCLLVALTASAGLALGAGIQGVLYAARRRPDTARRARSWALWSVYWLGLLAASPIANRMLVDRVKTDFAPVFAALEQHRARTGRYPASLLELTPAPPTCPGGFSGYRADRDGQSYCILCPIFALHGMQRCARDEDWRPSD